MKILILGYCPQRFMNPVVKELHKNGHSVDLISFRSFDISEEDRSYYHNVTNGPKHIAFLQKVFNLLSGLLIYGSTILKFLFSDHELGFSTKLGLIVKALINLQLTSHLKDYDIINIQMMAPMDAFYPFMNKQSKLICSYWGSDLLQADEEDLARQVKWLKKADKITVQSEELKQELLIKHSDLQLTNKVFKTLYPINQSIIRSILEKLPRVEHKNKLILTIGYNASENQNHLKILEQIDQLTDVYKQKIKLRIQLSYGGTESYIAMIKNKLSELSIEHELNTSFIVDEQIALKRIESDIFIHLPNTDAFCAALSESLVAQNIVITGSWLPYSLYDEHKVDIHKLNTIEDLSDLLKIVIDDIDHEKLKIRSNSNKVMDIINFEKAVQNWVTILEE